jgi:hypothetical protein
MLPIWQKRLRLESESGLPLGDLSMWFEGAANFNHGFVLSDRYCQQ